MLSLLEHQGQVSYNSKQIIPGIGELALFSLKVLSLSQTGKVHPGF